MRIIAMLISALLLSCGGEDTQPINESYETEECYASPGDYIVTLTYTWWTCVGDPPEPSQRETDVGFKELRCGSLEDTSTNSVPELPGCTEETKDRLSITGYSITGELTGTLTCSNGYSCEYAATFIYKKGKIGGLTDSQETDSRWY